MFALVMLAAPVERPFSNIGASLWGMMGGGVLLVLVGVFAFLGGFLLGHYMGRYQ